MQKSTLAAILVLAIPLAIVAAVYYYDSKKKGLDVNRVISKCSVMLEKLFWFGLGYLTARYLILKSGSDAYIQKEKDLIAKGSQLKDNIVSENQDQYIEEYQGY